MSSMRGRYQNGNPTASGKLPFQVFTEKVTGGTLDAMDLDALWRQKLALEMERAGGPVALASELAPRTPKNETIWTPNYLTQLLKPPKSFGKKVASQLEHRLGKHKGWINEPIAAPEAPRAVNPDRQSENDVKAVRMIVQSLVHSLAVTIPGAAPVFADHLEAHAKEERFSDLRGIVANAIGIARRVQNTAEAAGLLPVQPGSAAKTKRGISGRRG